MIDTSTREPLQVSTVGGAGPYMMVPESQLAQIRMVLDENKIKYWVDEETLSMEEEPPIAFINFAWGTDAANVQRLLDGIP